MIVTRISETPSCSLAKIGTYVKAENMAAPAIIWMVSVFKKRSLMWAHSVYLFNGTI